MDLPTMSQLLLAVVLALVSLTALVVLTNVLFAGLITRARANTERMPVRSFVVGLVNFIFFGLIALAFLRSEFHPAQVFGAVIATLLLGLLVFGLTAMARLIGERIDTLHGTLRQLVVGTLLVEFATLVPLVGWFLVPLVILLTGYGAVIIAVIWRK